MNKNVLWIAGILSVGAGVVLGKMFYDKKKTTVTEPEPIPEPDVDMELEAKRIADAEEPADVSEMEGYIAENKE